MFCKNYENYDFWRIQDPLFENNCVIISDIIIACYGNPNEIVALATN